MTEQASTLATLAKETLHAQERKAVWNTLLAVALLPAASAPAGAAEAESSIARGARLYDKGWEENKAVGEAAKGEVYFNPLCAGCHGTDGKKVKDGPPLGSVADNGAEMMHKLRNGQPAEAMPALRELDPQISTDIAVHLTKLPAK